MVLPYMLRCLALIAIIGGKTLQVHTTKLKVQTEAKRTSGEKKANLLATKHSAEPKDGHPCCFPVHAPVKQPDVHELHVHIHESKSILSIIFKCDYFSVQWLQIIAVYTLHCCKPIYKDAAPKC